MTNQNINAVARLSFATDSMVPKMKKMLSKDSSKKYSYNPAIDVEAGVMVATNGFSMAAHKLKDYRFEPEEQTMLPVSVVLPVEVLKMKGTVTVVLYDNNKVVATDAEGTRAEMKQFAYPNWRTAVPSQVSDVITILPATMTVALKELSKEVIDKSYPIRLRGEQGDKMLTMEWNPDELETPPTQKVSTTALPCKVDVGLSIKRLTDILAMKPEKMHFAGTLKAVLFYNSETLLLQMPMLGGVPDSIDVPDEQIVRFDAEEWIGTDRLGTVVVDNRPKKPTPKTQPTIEDRLRAALMQRLKQAA